MYEDSIKSTWKCPWEIYISSAGQDILCVLWILKVHICGPYLDPHESNSHPHILVIVRPILILSFHLCLDVSFWFYYHTVHAVLFRAMHITCPAHIIVLRGDNVMHSYCNTVDDQMLQYIALVLSDDYHLSYPPVICHVCVCVCVCVWVCECVCVCVGSQLSGLR